LVIVRSLQSLRDGTFQYRRIVNTPPAPKVCSPGSFFFFGQQLGGWKIFVTRAQPAGRVISRIIGIKIFRRIEGTHMQLLTTLGRYTAEADRLRNQASCGPGLGKQGEAARQLGASNSGDV
jgi:hypothetical protein